MIQVLNFLFASLFPVLLLIPRSSNVWLPDLETQRGTEYSLQPFTQGSVLFLFISLFPTPPVLDARDTRPDGSGEIKDRSIFSHILLNSLKEAI